jgi:hypothetical protein
MKPCVNASTPEHLPPVGTARGPHDLFDDPSPAFEADPPAPDE